MKKEVQQTIIATFILFTTMVSAQEPSLLIQGRVYQKSTKTGISSCLIYIKDSNGMVLNTTKTDSNGGYQIQIQSSQQAYKVEAEALGYNQAEVFVDNTKTGVAVNFGLTKNKESSQNGILPTVYFEYDSSYLTVKAKRELKKVLEFMKANPMAKISLSAHADSRGSDTYNNWLTSRRAERVRNWLVKEGSVDSARIEIHFYGKTQILNHCTEGVSCNALEHQENRRCIIQVVM